MFKSRYFLPSLASIIALVAVGGWYLNPFEKVSLEQENDGPDVVLYDIQLTEFNKGGNIDKRLQTSKLENYNAKNINIATKPNLQVFRMGKESFITADSAKMFAKQHKILLSGNVRVQQNDTVKGSATLKTDSLWYYPKQQLAYTKAPVIFNQAGLIIESNGVKIDLKNEKVQLLKQARGRYVTGHS